MKRMVSCLDMRRLAALAALLVLPAFGQFRDTVTVARILLDVRITDFDGNALTDLTADDFEVSIGGQKAEVLSATWVEDTALMADLFPPDNQPTGQPDNPVLKTLPPAGRLFVIFIQTDFSRNSERVRGQMHFLLYAEKTLEMLEPEDRVAVFSFDSHLKFRLDFTSDKEQILAAMKSALLVDTPPWSPVVHSPSLGSRLDRKAMKRAADSESALLLIGNALRPIPGPKSMLLMGWGLGELTTGGVRMKPKYKFARNALEAARVTIFALDTTYADYHSLEVGLGKAAADTGGFYAKTHVFAQQAIDRLRRTLTGHYELELRRPQSLRPGTHQVDVRVKRRGARVLAPATWMDR
jgi:VWFA-related protein